MIRFTREWRWLLQAQDAVCRATSDVVKILSDSDTPALQELIKQDPVANCYAQAILERGRQAGPDVSAEYGLFLGVENPATPGSLQAACWVGANIVPIQASTDDAYYLGQAALALNRRYASVFGPQQAVKAIISAMEPGAQQVTDLRPNQPLLTTTTPAAVPANTEVVVATEDDFEAIMPAAVAMFTEELGFSPLTSGANSYRHKIRTMLRFGFIVYQPHPNLANTAIFKADLGVVSSDCIQLQGVWMHPDYRGQGRATANVAAAINYSLGIAPVVSLYVNDFNTAALRTYHRVGLEQVGTFATALF